MIQNFHIVLMNRIFSIYYINKSITLCHYFWNIILSLYMVLEFMLLANGAYTWQRGVVYGNGRKTTRELLFRNRTLLQSFLYIDRCVTDVALYILCIQVFLIMCRECLRQLSVVYLTGISSPLSQVYCAPEGLSLPIITTTFHTSCICLYLPVYQRRIFQTIILGKLRRICSPFFFFFFLLSFDHKQYILIYLFFSISNCYSKFY